MAQKIQERIIEQTVAAVNSLFGQEINPQSITIQETRKEFEGQWTVVTFPITKFSKKSPEETGQAVGEYLQSSMPEIESFNIIKGFLNLKFSDSYWKNLLYSEILQDTFGSLPSKGEKVMVEYSSPNTNKPLHLGHVRNNLLGYSVSEILKAAGYEVIKANLVNDRGIHICKSMIAWEKFGNGETPESSGMKGDHLVGKYYVEFDKAYKAEIDQLKAQGISEEDAKKQAPIILEAQEMLQKWEAGDEHVIQLWKMMNSWVYAGFDVSYKRMGVDFDKYYYESDTYLLGKDIIQTGLQSGVFFKKEDGSVWVDLTDEGLDQKLVLRGDGTAVYITQDLGTAELKYKEFNTNKSIYVVGNEQDYHFKVLFSILKKLGKTWADGLYHLSYGMVDLPSGKMKSREGTVVDADDLMQEMFDTAKARTEELGKTEGLSEESKTQLYEMIGMGALKYFLLKVEPKKRLLFDPSESIDFQGHTGPFIQYTHARIKSVMSKGAYAFTGKLDYSGNLSGTEVELLHQLSSFNTLIDSAAKDMSPALIANYIFEVAKLYNKFYHEESILKVEEAALKQFRLDLSNATAKVIQRGMQLLGIAVPERM